MAKNALVVAGPKLQKALHSLVGTSPKTDLTAAHTPQKAQSVITRMGGESKSPSYNGYFTLKDVSTYNEDGSVKEFRVAVCDGETWDPETETSGVSIAEVSTGFFLEVPCTIFALEGTSTRRIWLKCGPTAAYKNEIIASDFIQLPGYSYYLIGDVSPGKIIQRHGDLKSYVRDTYPYNYDSIGMNGVAYVNYTTYYGDCSMRVKENEDGTSDTSMVYVCDGATWDPIKCTSEESTFYVNGTAHTTPCISIATEEGALRLVYDYISRETTLRYGDLKLEEGDIKGSVRLGTTLAYGSFKNIVPPSGEYRIWLFAPADCSGIMPEV